MELAAVELRRVRMPLAAPWRTAFGNQTVKDALLVRVIGPGAEGWGECVAMDAPVYSPEYVDGAAAVMRSFLVPRLWAARALTAGDVATVLAPVKGHPMAKAALELAVLDAELRTAGVPLAAHLGAERTRVPAGVSVGLGPSIPSLLDEVAGFVAAGYGRVKLKIAPGWDIEPVRAVRERFGDELLLQVDANGAYAGVEAIGVLGALDEFGLLLIEQPLADDDLVGHAALARGIRTPVCLDESVTSMGAALAAIQLGACRAINIKAGRVGGYLEARRIAALCAERGVDAWCGGMIETGIGRAANAALAACPGFTLPGDLSGSDRFFARDIAGPVRVDGGWVEVPTGPGIGVGIDEDAVRELTASVEELRPW